ncbi:hypothetical protein KW805_02450 [Candidatus Pacearchaeota archaeon]|nr:hypothetical protein [Candidatus Pacearchaeota archaeon]
MVAKHSLLVVGGLLVSMSLALALSDTTTFEANILASSAVPDIIRVEVPDHIFLGNVSKGEESQEVRVFVNNTGNVAIVVQPTLVDSNNEFFRYLYFRGQKTKTVDGVIQDVRYDRIGEFKFNISKPASKTFEDEDFYVILNLTDYTGAVPQNILGYKSDVKFLAVKQ